jgi:hypothetical protein
MAHFFEMSQPALVEVDVSFAKIRPDQVELFPGLRFIQGARAAYDMLNTGRVV